MKKFFIPMNGFIGWECKVCKASISGTFNKSTEMIEPSSKYWNVKRKEVYCGVTCALQRHTETAGGSN